MFEQQIAVLFPGQGSLDRTAFQAYQAACPGMVAMFAEVDDVAREFWRAPLATTLSGGEPGGRLDLLIFLGSLAAYDRLQREGVRPRALVGHGFGEIAALVAAGALSLRDGAEIVARRFNALASRKARCRMASVTLSPSAAATFLRILNDSRVAVAVENSSTETVLVGHRAAIYAAEQLARMLGVRFRRLKVTCGPHQCSMSGIEEDLLRSLAHITRRPPAIPVFSPLRGRLYRDDDDVVACLAQQLAEPLRFADAVSHLVAAGVTLFIECGPLRGLAAELDCRAVADVAFRSRFLDGSGADGTADEPRRLEVA